MMMKKPILIQKKSSYSLYYLDMHALYDNVIPFDGYTYVVVKDGHGRVGYHLKEHIKPGELMDHYTMDELCYMYDQYYLDYTYKQIDC